MKLTYRPSAEMAQAPLHASASVPSFATLTRSVVPDTRSRTKMSDSSFVSPATRLSAADAKTTNRPSAEGHTPTEGHDTPDGPLASIPPVPTLTRSVVPEMRSYMNTSANPFVSPSTTSLALVVKRT
jgi:hypothetical protein